MTMTAPDFVPDAPAAAPNPRAAAPDFIPDAPAPAARAEASASAPEFIPDAPSPTASVAAPDFIPDAPAAVAAPASPTVTQVSGQAPNSIHTANIRPRQEDLPAGERLSAAAVPGTAQVPPTAQFQMSDASYHDPATGQRYYPTPDAAGKVSYTPQGNEQSAVMSGVRSAYNRSNRAMDEISEANPVNAATTALTGVSSNQLGMSGKDVSHPIAVDPRHGIANTVGGAIGGNAMPMAVAALNPLAGAATFGAQGYGSAKLEGKEQNWTPEQTAAMEAERTAIGFALGLIPGGKAAGEAVIPGAVKAGLKMLGIGAGQAVVENKLRGELGLSSTDDLSALKEALKNPELWLMSGFAGATHAAVNKAGGEGAGREPYGAKEPTATADATPLQPLDQTKLTPQAQAVLSESQKLTPENLTPAAQAALDQYDRQQKPPAGQQRNGEAPVQPGTTPRPTHEVAAEHVTAVTKENPALSPAEALLVASKRAEAAPPEPKLDATGRPPMKPVTAAAERPPLPPVDTAPVRPPMKPVDTAVRPPLETSTKQESADAVPARVDGGNDRPVSTGDPGVPAPTAPATPAPETPAPVAPAPAAAPDQVATPPAADAGNVPPKYAMSKPIVGKTGAKIVGYHWASMVEDGMYGDRKVSDWSQAGTSTATGRSIVHHYYVEHPDGKITIEGVGSAQKILGISETRLQTIAKNEQIRQKYQAESEAKQLVSAENNASESIADAARKYRVTNSSPMRTPAENDAIFDSSTIYEKNGKFLRTQPNTDHSRMLESAGWTKYEKPTAPPAAPAEPVTHTRESLIKMKAADVGQAIKDMGMEPRGSKAENIKAILGMQESRIAADRSLKAQQAARVGKVNTEPKGGPWSRERLENNLVQDYLHQSGVGSEIERLQSLRDNEQAGLHPDDLERYSGADRKALEGWVNEDAASEHHLTNGETQAILDHANPERRMQAAKDWAKGSGNSASEFAHWFLESGGMGRSGKEMLSLKNADDLLGKTFEINGEKFKVHVDENDVVHLVDDQVEFPYADAISPDGKIPVDKGSMKDEHPATAADLAGDFVPKDSTPTVTKPGVQGSLLGERYETSGIGSKTGSMFGDTTRGPASELEAQTAREAADAKAQVDRNQGKIFGHGATPPQRNSEVARMMWGDKSALKNDVIPTAGKAASGLVEAAKDLRRVFAPQTAGAQARVMAGMGREHGAELAQRTDRAEAALSTARKYFQGQSKEANYAFIDKIETGASHDTPAQQKMADTMRELLDGRRQEVAALGKGQLENFIENYFPHFWKDPEKAAGVFSQAAGKRPLEGAKSFLKQRTIPTTADGLARGLEPISDNPVDLALLKVREMDRYILGQRMLGEMKEKGLAKFVRATDTAPEGYKRIDDKIAQVYGPPTITIPEHVDKAVYDGLKQTLDNLGIKHDRQASAGRGALGYSEQGNSHIVTKGGTELGVIAHELGHQLDVKLNLGRDILKPQFAKELRAVADLHEHSQSYFRTAPEKIASVVEAYVHAPERMREVAPQLYETFSNFIDAHHELTPLKDLKASLATTDISYEKSHGGLLKMGEYQAPEAVADVLNNYLSPGLRGKSALFRAVLGVGNVMNQAQLGLSAFHLGFTSLDAATSKFALGLNYLADGNVGQFVSHMAQTPIAPIENMVRGNKVLREWYRPGSQGAEMAQIVDAMKAAGGRARMDNFYRTNAIDRMMESFRKGNVLGGTLRAPLAGLEMAAKPIMEYIVPRQKMGVFADMARRELAKLPPGADHDAVRAAMGKAWDSVDNRMGQLVYDNLFWNKAAKDLSMASVRSLGWNLGTIRELGGGGIDTVDQLQKALRGQKPELTYRMAYLAAMPIVTGMLGAMLHYAYTGQAPQELKDYFYPKTGEQDEEGKDKRISLPSYMKDVYSYAHAPGQTLLHKLHPDIGLVSDMLQNKDFYGVKIHNEDDPITKQLLDTAKYVGKQFIPFGIRNAQTAQDQGGSTQSKVLPFVGLTPAPRQITTSPAEELAANFRRDMMPVGARTTEQADKSKLQAQLRSAVKTGKPDADEKIQQAIAAGTISTDDAKKVYHDADKSYLERTVSGLPAEATVKVYEKADTKEKAQIHDLVRDKIVRSDLPTDAQDNLMAAHGITPPPDLSLDREYKALSQKAQADTQRQQKLDGLSRQITAAEQARDWNKGAELRQERAGLLRAGRALAGADLRRYDMLKDFRQQRTLAEQRIKEGTWSPDAAENRLTKFRDRLRS